MKRTMKFLVAALFIFGLPLAAGSAESREPGMQGGSPQGQKGAEPDRMRGEMLILGDQPVDGVRAMAHLQDVTAAMTRMGMAETHHFMVAFVDTATGKPIASGAVTLKIKGPSGRGGGAVRLLAMEGPFGADLTLAEKGVYTFTLDARVAGEQRRRFEFKHEVKQSPDGATKEEKDDEIRQRVARAAGDCGPCHFRRIGGDN